MAGFRNIISNFFQIGNNTQNISQNNYISNDVGIAPFLKSIKMSFSLGQYKKAMNDLSSAFEVYDGNELIKYDIHLTKLQFLLSFRKIEEANKLLKHLEKNYSSRNDILRFKELKMSLMAFNQDKKYFDFVDDVIEDIDKSKPRGHFEIVYFLNGGKLEEATEVFEREILNTKYEKHLYLPGGHIYSNTYRHTDEDKENYTRADKFYKLAIEHCELDFLDKMQIDGFYAIYYINNYFTKKIIPNIEELKKNFHSYRDSLKHIMDYREYFDEKYIETLADNYLFSLMSSDNEEEYINFFETLDPYLIIRHYLTYCSLKNNSINHNEVQLRLLSKKSFDDIVAYSALFNEQSIEDKKKAFDFFTKEMSLILISDYTLFAYVIGATGLKMEIEKELLGRIEENKYNSLEYILSYFEISLYKDTLLSEDDINKLEEYGNKEIKTEGRVLLVLNMLQRVNHHKKFLDLAISKQGLFKSVIAKTLKLCTKDRNILLNDFDKFVTRIENKDKVNADIGNIYNERSHLENAFKHYFMYFEQNKGIEIAKIVLTVSWQYYHKFNNKMINNIQQTKVYNYLIGQLDELETDLLLIIFGYSFVIEKNTSNIYGALNQFILNTPIESMDKELKIALSNVHIQTMIVSKKVQDELILVESNKCLVKDGYTYIKTYFNIDESYIKKYGFRTIDEDEYALKLEDELFEEQSLFHRLVGPFAYRCENPEIMTFEINTKSKNPMESLVDFMGEQTKINQNIFKKYDENKDVSLYKLSSNQYKNYFSLVPFLIENTIRFNSGFVNPKPTSIKKLLTLSSLIMLEHLNMLDEVLKRSDIFIQRTVVDFLIVFEEEISSNTELIKKLSDNFTYNILLNAEQEDESMKILSIIKKIRIHKQIVNDHKEVFPVKGISELLESFIGVQETQALAYAMKHQYQIITEDRMYYRLTAILNIKNSMLSNCMGIIFSTLQDINKSNMLRMQLHQKNYFPVLETNYSKILEDFMFTVDFDTLTESNKELFRIAYSYGCLDLVFNKYNFKLQVLNTIFRNDSNLLFDINVKKVLIYLQDDIKLLS